MHRRLYGDELLVQAVREELAGHLFHLTDESHFSSIEQYGLLSARARANLGIQPAFPGGNELTQALDEEHGLDYYVFLGFRATRLMPQHGDWGRRPVLLTIDPEVFFLRGARVSLGRAHRKRTMIYEAARAFYEMDWEALCGEVDDNDLTQRSRNFNVWDYEVHIPERVPLEYITGIA